MKAGVPDLFLPVSRDGYHGLFIELKRQAGGRVSDEQKEWIQELRDQGYRVEVCKGWEAAAGVLKNYLGPGEGESLGLNRGQARSNKDEGR